MNEDFLHYVWKFQKFVKRDLKTISGDILSVVAVGQHNLNSGPDFFNAKLTIGEQLWAGNVEIHIKASDWYVHQHQKDDAYDSVILHVVWEYDADIFRKDGTTIPTLELKRCIASEVIVGYRKLFKTNHKWINCEEDFAHIDSFLLKHWLERLYVERLEQKATRIELQLKAKNNHWEAVLFELLCKNFGLKVNGASFLSIAQSVDFSVVQKCSQHQIDLESLLLGQAGLLEGTFEEGYFLTLQKRYAYIKHKFQVSNHTVIPPKYFRLRPPNFPTIRLSQLATLYCTQKHLFSAVVAIASEAVSEEIIIKLYKLFSVSASSYWDTHYNFGVISGKRSKKVTKKFVDLLLINTLVPVLFCYGKQQGSNSIELLLQVMKRIVPEENSVVTKFNQLQSVAHHAFESQAVLQLKETYCDKNRCTECAIGNAILKGTTP